VDQVVIVIKKRLLLEPYSLLDNFNVHKVVSIVTYGNSKVQDHCVVLARHKNVNTSDRTQRNVHFGTIDLRKVRKQICPFECASK